MNVGVYLDLSDLYHRVNRRFGRKLNFGVVVESFDFFGVPVVLNAYGIQVTNEANNFIACLERCGLMTFFKRPEIIRVGDREIKRSNWELGIGMDVARKLDDLDTVILGTGSARMVPLVEYVRDQGRKCIIFGIGVEKELKKAADAVAEITKEFLE